MRQATAIKIGSTSSELDGTYRNRPAYVAAWASSIGVGVLAVVTLTVWRTATGTGTALGAAAIALAGAGFLWWFGVRPRFTVSSSGVTITNSTGALTVPWERIRGFECQGVLFVLTDDGEHIPVRALPANGLRRNLFGRPGPVDRLTDRLNARLVELRGDAATPPRSWIETEGSSKTARGMAWAAVVSSAVGMVFVVLHNR